MKISENALKDGIKNLANETGSTIKELLKRVFLERFLARLARSPLSDKLIFKGGNLLSYYISIGRETTDLDFLLTKVAAEESAIKKAFETICQTAIDDGFAMNPIRIESLTHAHLSYPGFRTTVKVKLKNGGLNDNIQIDVGVGDKVDPKTRDIPLLRGKKKSLYEDSISLKVYPPESIFAEKLETVVSLGPVTSRMKDFHDLILLSRADDLMSKPQLEKSIVETFNHRGTSLDMPIRYEAKDLSRLNTFWNAHGATMSSTVIVNLNLPKTFDSAVSEINGYISTLDLSEAKK